MSLKHFHIAFIVTAAALMFGCAVWGLKTGGEFLSLGIVCLGVGVTLVGYGIWARKKLNEAETHSAS